MTVNITATCLGSDIDDIIEVSAFVGRRFKTDVYSSSTAQITVRNPQSLPASVVLEAYVSIAEDGDQIYGGYITDISYYYGWKTEYDTATISLEGYLSFLGRGLLNNFTMANKTTGETAQDIGISLSGSGKTIGWINTRSYVDTSTYTGNAQNLLTALVAMEQGRLLESGADLDLLGRDYTYDLSIWPYVGKFTDVNPATTGTAFNAVTFASASDNYFTQVTITSASVAQQTAGTGSRNLQLNTYDKDTTQASNLAKYTLGEFDKNTSVPISVTSKSSLNSLEPVRIFATFGGPGLQTSVTFRGTTYPCVMEGYSVTATPEDAVYTIYLSGFEQNNYLKLNNSVFGKLDENQLSF